MMRARLGDATRGVKVLFGLAAALIVARLVGMAAMPLMETTEARYGEIGRKMAEFGDWVTPWFDIGVPFWGKPPLSFWLTALSFRALGIDEFAARLPHFLCALGIALLTWRLGAGRSRSQGALAVALLIGSVLFYVSAGAVMTDGALVLGTTMAMVGFWHGLHGPQVPRQPERWLLFAGIAVGLLAKGPVALVLIGVPLLCWTVGNQKFGAVWRAFPWLSGLAWVAVVVVPWYVAAEWRTPGFLQYFLVGEHWHRFLTPGWKGDLYGNAHRYPPGTIWAFAFGATMPWSVLLPVAALYRRLKGTSTPAPAERPWQLYLWLWALTPLVFFTAARNIIWTYVLPALPAIALLGARWLARWRPVEAQRLVAAGLLLSLAGAVVFGVNVLESGRAARKSAKALVQAYGHYCQGQGPLIYLGALPYSASFYTGGQVQHAQDADHLVPLVQAAGACVAVSTNDAELQHSLASMAARPVARVGAYALLKLEPHHVSGSHGSNTLSVGDAAAHKQATAAP